MQWPITTGPWAICKEDEKSRSNSKSLFRNSLQKMSPIPSSNAVPFIYSCVIDVMRVIRIIPVSDLNPPTFLKWTSNVCVAT